MPLYGTIAQVKKMLRPEESARFGTDVDDRLTALRAAVSATIERELGRRFGVAATPTSELIWAGDSPVLVFRRPFRDILSVEAAVLIAGGAHSGGYSVAAGGYAHDPVDPERGWIYGLRRLDGLPWGSRDPYGNPSLPVLVTGYLAEGDDDTTVPPEIDYVANLLMLELFKRENASPAGAIGPDGTVTPLRDPYREPQVVRIFDLYRTRRVHRAV